MTNLQVNLRSADVENAVKITQILYSLVENREIESITINKIKKGANSLDINSLIPLINDGVKELGAWIPVGVVGVGATYGATKVIHEIISTIKDGIELSEKIKGKKSFMGLHCKIGRQNIVKFGRSYGIPYFDTIMTSATLQSIDDTLLAKNQWGEIPISRERYPLIKHIALFVKTPHRSIEWVGKVKEIKYNPNNKKSTIYLDGKPERIPQIPYDKKCPQHNGHGTVYTTLERIRNAKTLCDVYPSLDQ